MSATEINKDNFTGVIEGNDIVFMDFWAPWCGPCRAFGPVYEKVSELHPDVVFGKCNTEQERELAGALQIQAIPTLMAFRDKVLVFRRSGALPEPAFKDLVEKVKELDMDEVRRVIAKEEAEAKKAEEAAATEPEHAH